METNTAAKLPSTVVTDHARPRRYQLTVLGGVVWFTRLAATGRPVGAAEPFSWSVSDVAGMLLAGRLKPVLH
jgi:hypothetical protein